jgi:hypothetical protein
MMKDEESKSLSGQESFSPFVHWMIQKRKALVLATSALLVAVICFAIIRSKNTKQYFQDIQRAEVLAEDLEQVNPQEDPEKATSELMSICSRQKDLKPRYDGIIAQNLIIEGKPSENFAEGAIESLQVNNLPLFSQFSEITLLSEQGKLPEALSKAKALLENSPNFTLRACTLLQIASLQRAVKQQEGCKKTVEELRQLLKSDPQGEKILSLIEKQHASLLDFLIT